jgi:hypothetical protein
VCWIAMPTDPLPAPAPTNTAPMTDAVSHHP